MSTLLAGLFCVLYLTKPVHLVSPLEREESVSPLPFPVQEQSPPDEGINSGFENLVAAPAGKLNPLQGNLPGDELLGVGAGNTAPILFESESGDAGLKPLVIERPRKALFVPIETKPSDEAGKPPVAAVAEVAMIEASGPDGSGGLSVEIPDAGASELVAIFTEQERLEESHAPVDWENGSGPFEQFANMNDPGTIVLEPQESQAPSASIIGEFYVSESAQNRSHPEQGNDLFH